VAASKSRAERRCRRAAAPCVDAGASCLASTLELPGPPHRRAARRSISENAPDLGNHQVPHGKPDVECTGSKFHFSCAMFVLSIGMLTIPCYNLQVGMNTISGMQRQPKDGRRRRRGDCPMTRLIGVIASKWAMPVLYNLLRSPGPLRFTVLRRSIGRVTQRELSLTLKRSKKSAWSTARFFPRCRRAWNIGSRRSAGRSKNRLLGLGLWANGTPGSWRQPANAPRAPKPRAPHDNARPSEPRTAKRRHGSGNRAAGSVSGHSFSRAATHR